MPGTALAALTIAAVVLACGGDPGLAGGREEGGGRALPAVTEGDLVVSSVVMPAPVTPERAALYLDVRNGGSEPDTLVAVDLGALGSAGLHETVTTDGVARMRPRDRVPVQGGATLRFRPGGLHVMVEGLTRVPAAGDTVPVELRFSRAGPVAVRAVVVTYADLEDVLDVAG